MVWALARSLATTYAIIIIFSSYGYLDVSVPHVRPSFDVIGFLPIGFPHSDIPASRVICTSTGLFAAYHVLRRLREPRHPPSALLLLFIFNWSFITERTIRFIYRLFFSIFTLISLSLLCIEAILRKYPPEDTFSRITSTRSLYFVLSINVKDLIFTNSQFWALIIMWRITDSNRWPPACKAGALASWANPPYYPLSSPRQSWTADLYIISVAL